MQNGLQQLFVDELKDIYHAEHQVLKALPKMAKKATSQDLQRAFQTHLKQTEAQIDRLEQVFESIGEKAKGKPCKGMKGLIEEGQEAMEEDYDAEVLDAALISSAQRVEHYEIAGYGTLRTFAQTLGHKEAAKLLDQILKEEGKTDKLLTQLATSHINQQATH
jgi:ferritin-like metal-binding protein YciE